MVQPNRIEQLCRQLTAQGTTITPLCSGNPNDHGIVFPGDQLSAIYLAYFQDQHYRPDPLGQRKAREAIAAYYATAGHTVDPEQILITAGTSESFSYLCWLLCQPGDHLLLPAPGYPLFTEIAQLHQVACDYYPVRPRAGAWHIDVDALAAAITPQTRAIVCVSPHNPTGMVTDAATWDALAALANAHQLPLIVDEVFAEFCFSAQPFPRAMAAAPAACFTLNGISKMCALPNLKLGWIAVTGTDPRIPDWMEQLACTADHFLTCHEPIQRGLPRLLTRTPPFLAEYRAQLSQRRAIALTALQIAPQVTCIPPAGGFYLTAQITSPRWTDDEALVCAVLESSGMFFHPGYFFDCPDDGVYIVCSYLTTPDTLTRGIQALLEVL